MKFAIISHVPHIFQGQKWHAYSPYVREMNIWLGDVDSVLIVAPISDKTLNAIHLPYNHQKIELVAISSFDVKSIPSIIATVFKLPRIIIKIFTAMKEADHIHLRCPGNIGLLGCLLQIFFPKKPKTAKYAGNWDSKSNQPLSYRLQKWLLSNTFLTKNMQVLVYGKWSNSTKNIKPFFTATYQETDKKPIVERNFKSKIIFLFVGTLSKGKRPLYAVQLMEQLLKWGYDVQLKIYGEGTEREILETYCKKHNLDSIVCLMGNRGMEDLKVAYQQSHFLVLPSQSEGWPKVVAEAMFWGCVPIASKVSCVPSMLNNQERGLLLEMDLEEDAKKIAGLTRQPDDYLEKRDMAMHWSRIYTLDYFEEEIKKLLNQ